MRIRILVLTAIHSAIGVICALTAQLSPGRNWPAQVEFGFLTLIASQMLLIGMWAGLSRARWWKRFIGGILGLGYLLFIGIAASPNPNSAEMFVIGLLLALPTTVLASLFLLIGRFYAQVVSDDRRILGQATDGFQFSTRQLLYVTLGISIVLAFGRTVRSLGGEAIGMGVFALVIALCGALIMLLLVWSSLGRGRVVVRLPLVICGAAIIGLVPPYYFGGPWWRFVTWPVLVTSVALIVGGSLLVIRRCDYRFVRLSDMAQIERNQILLGSQMQSEAT